MAVPKRKTSKQRKHTRAANWKISAPNLIECPQCHKKISPHKLRSTYGTMLYNETGDIYLVADVLGHRDVNTTKKHYAALSEDRRRRAAEVIKLRDDVPDDSFGMNNNSSNAADDDTANNE